MLPEKNGCNHGGEQAWLIFAQAQNKPIIISWLVSENGLKPKSSVRKLIIFLRLMGLKPPPVFEHHWAWNHHQFWNSREKNLLRQPCTSPFSLLFTGTKLVAEAVIAAAR